MVEDDKVTLQGDNAVVEKRKGIDWKLEISRRLLSRKFWLAAGSLIGTMVGWQNGTIAGNEAMLACLGFVTAYILGESYIDGKKQENMPSDLQEKLIAAAVQERTAQELARYYSENSRLILPASNPAELSQHLKDYQGGKVMAAPVTDDRRNTGGRQVTLTPLDQAGGQGE